MHGLIECPSDLAKFKGAPVPAAAQERVGEAARVQPHTSKQARIQASHRSLGMGSVGQSECAHLAVTPRLLANPLQCVVAVESFINVLGESTVGGVAAPAVLDDGNVSMAGEETSFKDRGLGGFVVRGTVEKHWQRPLHGLTVVGGTVNIRSQVRPVTHEHCQVVLGMNLEYGLD